MSHRYQNGVSKLLHHRIISGVFYVVVIGILVLLFQKLPSSFLPDEDQGVVMTLVQLPPNASLSRTEQVVDTMTGFFLENEKEYVQSVFSVAGFSFTGVGQNAGLAFIRLKDWSERTTLKHRLVQLSSVVWH